MPWLGNLRNHAGALPHIVENMREWDRREISAMRIGGSLLAVPTECIRLGEIAWVAGDERPIAAFGCAPLWEGVWSMWLFATDEFNKIGIFVTRFVLRAIIPQLWASGAHRLECRSMEGHEDAQRWLELIGAKREGTLFEYGRGREDFHVYAWRRP